MICYMITNSVNGKRYIGMTKFQLEQRWKAHCYGSIKGVQTSLARAIRKYGKEHFCLKILYEAVNRQELSMVEKAMIAQYSPEYNITYGGDEGIRDASKVYWSKPGTREHASKVHKKIWSDPAYKARQKVSSKLAWENEDRRAKASKTVRARLASKEARARMSRIAKESSSSSEARSFKSKVAIAAWNKPGERARRSADYKKRWSNPEFKARVSASIRLAKSTPAARERLRYAASIRTANKSIYFLDSVFPVHA